MNNKSVSIIVPVYNVEKYLEECLDSIINQTYIDLDIILVDDGSTDSSPDICERYAEKDNRIRVIHKENGGLSSSRNSGLDYAQGEYVYFLDSDDYLEKDAIDLLIKETENKPDIVFFDAKTFADEDYHGKINVSGYIRKCSYCDATGHDMTIKLFNNKEFHYSVPLLLLKKAFIENNSLRFYEGIINEDMVFTFEAFIKAQSVKYLNKALYNRRLRPGSIVTSKKLMLSYESSRKIYDEIKCFTEKCGEKYEDVCLPYLQKRAITVINKFDELNKEDKNKVSNDYNDFIYDVLNNNAFGDKALKLRCKSKFRWFVYKVFKKIF